MNFTSGHSFTPEEIKSLWSDKAYGIYTRPAIEIIYNRRAADEIHYLILVDLDNIHNLNSQYATAESDGYDIVDGFIRAAFSSVRDTDLFILVAPGRYKSGDEVAFLIRGDPVKFCERLQESLNEQGLSATMAWTEPLADFEATAKTAAIKVKKQKQSNQRGIISRA